MVQKVRFFLCLIGCLSNHFIRLATLVQIQLSMSSNILRLDWVKGRFFCIISPIFVKMSVHTILLDFSVDPSVVKTESQLPVIASNIENVLREYLSGLKLLTSIPFETDLFQLYSGEGGISVNLRIFKTGLITINIEYLKNERDEELLNFEVGSWNEPSFGLRRDYVAECKSFRTEITNRT